MLSWLQVREWVKLRQLRAMLADGVSHIKSCPVCQGKGFVCEFCINTQDIIFPFEAQKVSSCKGWCVHVCVRACVCVCDNSYNVLPYLAIATPSFLLVDCRCCFHKDCFKNSTACPRCSRMKERSAIDLFIHSFIKLYSDC